MLNPRFTRDRERRERVDRATRELYRSLRLIKSGNFTIAAERILEAADSKGHDHQYESRPAFGEPHMVCVTCGGDLYDPNFNPLARAR